MVISFKLLGFKQDASELYCLKKMEIFLSCSSFWTSFSSKCACVCIISYCLVKFKIENKFGFLKFTQNFFIRKMKVQGEDVYQRVLFPPWLPDLLSKQRGEWIVWKENLPNRFDLVNWRTTTLLNLYQKNWLDFSRKPRFGWHFPAYPSQFIADQER